MGRGEPLIRQWTLLRVLQSNRYGLPVDELAGRLECSGRQVQRDLRVLELVGFPVDHREGDFGKRFWTLRPGFLDSDGLVLSMTEALSLFLSQQLLLPLAGTVFGEGLGRLMDKTRALLPPTALGHFRQLERTLLVKSAVRGDYSGQADEIRTLNQAASGGRVLRVAYHSASQDRLIETDFSPYGLVYFGSSLYCIGHLAEYDEVRTLKVDRFRAVAPTDRSFCRPADFSLEAYTQGSFGVFTAGKPRPIRVHFTGWAATNVREQRWHPTQRIVRDGPDGVLAEFALGDTTEFIRWVLGFGPCARVVAPADLARTVRRELQVALAGYDAPASARAKPRAQEAAV